MLERMSIMKRKCRLTAGVISVIMAANSAVTNVYSLCDDEHEDYVPIASAAQACHENVHAYDPIAELEAEQAYREAAKITENKIIFSVLDQRADDADAQELSADSPICNAAKLNNVSKIMEVCAENIESQDGFTAYEVFYEAYTDSEDVWDVADQLLAEETVLSAEPDFIWDKADYAEPTDEEMSNETHFNDLHTADVWSDLQQSNVPAPGYGTVVAVIDTGVDYTHFDLKNSMWKNTGEIPGNGIDDDENGFIDDVYGIDLIENDGDPMDDHGHGTHVAGIIAMEPGNGGGVGLAYGAKIMAIKAGQSNGQFASSDIAKAIKYAADNGADVICMSFGGEGKSSLVEAAVRDAFSTAVLVAAAGNDGKPTEDGGGFDCYPAAYSNVLGVMATDRSGGIADFSNWDYTPGQNGEYELAAPGVGIYSTLPGDRFASWGGTSMAAANVAAAAAILRNCYSNKSKYTSGYIMGQLVSATTGRAGIYPALNITDSLTIQPQPKLVLNEFYQLEDASASEINNGDGIAQPGEVIDLGVSAFNSWGDATDVTVTVKPADVDGADNPYVEMIKDTAEIGGIRRLESGNNGLVFTDGNLTGVTVPLRFRIMEGVTNDTAVPFEFTVTAKNGFDEEDTEVYSFTGSYTVVIQNRYTISGTITEDLTLTADKYWVFEGMSVIIPEGVTVTVEPGTQIECKVGVLLEGGKFFAEGTEEKPIEMFSDIGFTIGDKASPYVREKTPTDPGNNVNQSEAENINLKYTKCLNGYISGGYADHCVFEYDFYDPEIMDEQLCEEMILVEAKSCYFGKPSRNYMFEFYYIQDVDQCLFEGWLPYGPREYTNTVLYAPSIRIWTDELLQEPYPLEDDLSAIYPFMTEAYLTDADGTVLDLVGAGQTVTMHVKFNRDMAQDVQPDVSCYMNQPFTEYKLSGEWVSAREWTSTFTIDPYADMGRMYIRSKGAVAADDRWLVTGDDQGRFFFDVTSISVQSMSLKGTAASGSCELSWVQDDYDTLAGYNVYRGTAYDSSKSVLNQGFQKINSYILNQAAYTDADVIQGKDYYYYFTVLDTAFRESAPSNVVKCTPLDATPPVITHTQLAAAPLGEPVSITAKVQDNLNVAAVTLYYRPAGETEWRTAAMRSTTESTYKAVISAYEITGEAVEYYITASDGRNTAASASADHPLTVIIDANHQYDEGTVKSPATCTEDGLIVYKCTDCGHEITERIPVLGHAFSDTWTVDREATCTAEGERSHHCTRCEERADVTVIPMTEHVWDAGKILKSNSCTSDGLKHFKCIDCDAEKDMVVPATGHDYQETVHPATCTERGFTEHLCQNCGESYQSDFTEIAEHSYEETVLSEATCTTDGVKQLCCTHCEHKISEVIPAYGHHFEDAVVEPTADAFGYTLHTCENCGYSYTDNYTAYTSDEPNVRTPGDANEDGLVDLVDVILIRRYLAGGWNVTINLSNADVDGDGEVTLTDVILIRRYLAGGWNVQLK